MHRAMALEAAAGPIRVDEDGGPAIVYAEMLADGDDLDVARVHVERLVDGARQAGDLAVSYALFVLAYLEYDAGRWERAQEAAAESLDLSVTTGREATEVLAAAALALVRGGRGDVEDAGRLGEHGLDLANRIGRGGRAPRAALGLLELAREDAAAAWGWLEPAVGRIVPLGLDQPSPPVTDAAEALAALGRFDEADRLAALTESNARRLGPRWTIAMALRARASVAAGRGDDRAAEAFLDQALTVGSSGRPLEKGRTLLMLGSVCRRLRKKRKAAEALGLALSIFERLPAPIWADRTRHEMARIGGRPMAVGGAVGASLSATEDGIVRLVRRGRTNREIAEELALSPKTVEWNLTRIYRKLGVRSRTELAARGAPRGT
jgi:DNA-binding CsgD family transcriptional regulator